MKLFTDGGARGNPGPAGCGMVIKDDNDQLIKEWSYYMGTATNNQAEYTALLLWLDEINRLPNNSPVICYLDSELIVKQLNGIYKVKNPQLKEIYLQVQTLRQKIKDCQFVHVPRAQNKEADKMANIAMDNQFNKSTPNILKEEKQISLF